MIARHPARSIAMAAPSPQGPAPTTTTSVSNSNDLISSRPDADVGDLRVRRAPGCDRGIGAPAIGRSSRRRASVVGRCHPSIHSYRGRTASSVTRSPGNSVNMSPSSSYPVQRPSRSSVSSTSSLVTASPVSPLTRAAYRTTTASNQPHRRGRPVVAPYSLPSSADLAARGARRAPSAAGRCQRASCTP